MEGYPYGGNPQYPPPQNSIYPHLHNPGNAPGQVPMMQPQHPLHNPSVHPQAFSYPQPGFGYPGQQQGFPGHHPGYPGVAPAASAPPYPYGFGMPTVTPVVQVQPTSVSPVEWVPTTPRGAPALVDRALVAGYEGHDKSPLWVIRASHEGEVIPGKLAVKHHTAYIPWGGKEIGVNNIEVCCVVPDKVRWEAGAAGSAPSRAVPAGRARDGEVLYVGRAQEQGSLTPGKVHQSHKVLYISFGGLEIPHKTYEVLCTV